MMMLLKRSFSGPLFLGPLNLLLQGRRGQVAVLGLGKDEAESDKLVRVVQLEEIVPVALIKPRHGRQDQHVFLVLDGLGRYRNIVEIVTRDGRRAEYDARSRVGLPVRRRRRRQVMLGRLDSKAGYLRSW